MDFLGGIKMNFKFKKASIFLKYLFSYLLIFIIPILILTFTLSNKVFNALENEALKNEHVSMQVSTYNITNELQTCSRIAEQLNSPTGVQPFSLETQTYKAIELIDTLKKYKVTNNFFDSVFVHFFSDIYIYSESSSYSSNTISQLYKLNNIDPSTIKQRLYSIKEPTFINNLDITVWNSKKEYTLLAIPLTYNSEIKGVVAFLIDNDKLNKTLGNTDNADRKVYLTNGNILLNSSNNSDPIREALGEDTLKSITSQLNNKAYLEKQMDKYIIYGTKLKSSGLNYISITSTKEIFKKVTAIQRFMLFILLFTLITGIIIIYLLLKLNYKPIKQLKNLSTEVNSSNQILGSNEIDIIKNALTFLNKRNTELEYELEQNIPIRQNFMLNQLINGNLGDVDTFIKECDEVNLNLKNAYHSIVTVKSKDSITSLSYILSKTNIQNFSFNYEYLIHQTYSDITIFIVGMNETEHFPYEELYIDNNLTISFGSIEDSLINIPKSYIKSRTNLDLNDSEVCKLSGLSTTSEEANITKVSTASETYNLPIIDIFLKKYDKNLEAVRQSLYNWDVESLNDLVINTVIELDKELIPFELLRDVYLEIIVIFNIFFEKNKHIIEYSNIDLTTLYEIKDKEALKEVFLETFNEMLPLIKNKFNAEVPLISVQAIKKCIEENYTDYSFSLQIMASKFNVSFSYLSQYFKEKTGITILDYITQLKIDKAKELLQTTTLPLKDIGEQIGYLNVSSFIRRFKQVTGLTPGEFRKI